MDIGAKFFNKILADRIQEYLKMMIHHDQVGFITETQGWSRLCKWISTPYKQIGRQKHTC